MRATLVFGDSVTFYTNPLAAGLAIIRSFIICYIDAFNIHIGSCSRTVPITTTATTSHDSKHGDFLRRKRKRDGGVTGLLSDGKYQSRVRSTCYRLHRRKVESRDGFLQSIEFVARDNTVIQRLHRASVLAVVRNRVLNQVLVETIKVGRGDRDRFLHYPPVGILFTARGCQTARIVVDRTFYYRLPYHRRVGFPAHET